jgi:hypothetical protein
MDRLTVGLIELSLDMCIFQPGGGLLPLHTL